MPLTLDTSTARLIAPRRALASCVRAHVTRDTTGLPLLPQEQRFNCFPATTFCSITWFIEGSSYWPLVADANGTLRMPPEPVPRILFAGPQTRPHVSYNPGPVHGFVLMMFAPAVHALTGLDLAAQVDRAAAVEQVLDASWQQMAQAVLQAPDDDTRVRLIEDFLEPRWLEARRQGRAPGTAATDWVQALSLHLFTSGFGRSARSLERRVKAWAGQSLRRLRRMHRGEQSFLRGREQLLSGDAARWAELAASSGYADQAHMCRDTREVTGLSPTELLHKAQHDEPYWIYRIWS